MNLGRIRMNDTDNDHFSDLGLGDPRLCILCVRSIRVIGLFYWGDYHSDVSRCILIISLPNLPIRAIRANHIDVSTDRMYLTYIYICQNIYVYFNLKKKMQMAALRSDSTDLALYSLWGDTGLYHGTRT